MHLINPEVKAVYQSYSEPFQSALLRVRGLIYEVADEIPSVGNIEETLKWGQPTYTTSETKSGTPIRLDRFEDDKIALFVHCQTSLIDQIKLIYKDQLEFSRTRAIVLDADQELPVEALKVCIEMALTYHKNKARFK